jgi:energy-coupling factor transporter ATP-binding protein EcfA2
MVKLKRLKIEKYRNVKPGTELHFRDSLTIMLGRNGTGKTTLLNLIVQLLSWDFTRLQDEPVDLEYGLLTAEGELLVRVRSELIQEPPGTLPEHKELSGDVLAIGLAQSEPRYSMSLVVDIFREGAKHYLLKVEGSRLTLENTDGTSSREVAQTRQLLGLHTLRNLLQTLRQIPEPSPDGDEVADTLWSAMGALGFLRRFDESLGYLDHITQEGSFLARKLKVGGGKTIYVVSSDGGPRLLSARLMDGINSEPNVDEFRVESSDEGAWFLARFVELLECRSARLLIQRTARTTSPYERIDFGNIRFDFIRRDGSITNHTLLSYGQKRLLAFYYYLASNPECVVADELVNGMHHEWIEACLEDIEDRQAFLTSQNPLLLDYLSFESAEEVRSSFVLCRTELHDGREQMVWENMTAEDSEGFFKAYKVAIQHVSELLRTRGLW